MTIQIMPFLYDSQEIRTLMIEDQPWFVAVDICNALNLSNPSVTIQSLDEDERSKKNLGRQGKAWIINESGLYYLIFRSNKAEAKVFRKWVTAEVLPSLRRTGSHTVSPIEPVQNDLANLIKDAALVAGSQAKLAKRIGVSAATLSMICNGGMEKFADEMYRRIELNCTAVLNNVFGVDHNTVEMLLKVEDKELRMGLYSKMCEGGVI